MMNQSLKQYTGNMEWHRSTRKQMKEESYVLTKTQWDCGKI